jgi:hypothetical protein
MFFFEVSSEGIYEIRIKITPSRFDANHLSKLFNWPISNILMRPSSDQRSLTECWLRDVPDEQMATDFIEKWHGKSINESRITCQLEKDQRNLCRYFQIGHCTKPVGDCDWQHIKCIEYDTCSTFNCLYGHAKGVKTKMINDGMLEKKLLKNNFLILVSNETYRIKITGFQTALTPQLLAHLLDYKHEKQCYIFQSNPQIGYIVKLNTITFAKRLIQEWHDKEIEGGHKLKCQLELNIFPSKSDDCSNFISTRNDRRPYRTSYQSSDCTSKNSRDSSVSKDDNDFNTIKHPAFNTERKESSAESTTSITDVKCK